jgi:hypothetical protein
MLVSVIVYGKWRKMEVSEIQEFLSVPCLRRMLALTRHKRLFNITLYTLFLIFYWIHIKHREQPHALEFHYKGYVSSYTKKSKAHYAFKRNIKAWSDTH